MRYDTVIGLEVHLQLKTASKMFCSDSTEYGGEPNTKVCPTCLGLPGSLPVINKKALELALKVGLALNCKILSETKFDRKSYFYPDLPKGYQISQYDLPLAVNGYLIVNNKKIRIQRAHLEEDTGKLVHTQIGDERVSLIDFNRSGVPLMEIVSEPEISSPVQAKDYAQKLHQIMRYTSVSDADMEKAGMRFDANISIKSAQAKKLGVKVEVKNINSFKFLEKALEYEVNRQIRILEEGGKIVQETRGWVETKGITVSQRIKEIAPEYRYFPEPDLPPLAPEINLIKRLKEELPELPDEKVSRFVRKYGLDEKVAVSLCFDKDVAFWFEDAVSSYSAAESKTPQIPHIRYAKTVANWIIGELFRFLKEENKTTQDLPITGSSLAELLYLIDKGEINQNSAKEIFNQMLKEGRQARELVKEYGLEQISDTEKLEVAVEKILQKETTAVSDFKKGKGTAFGFLIGKIMKETSGRANPKLIKEILEVKLR